MGYKKKRDFVYNTVIKIWNKIIDVGGYFISNNKNLFDYLDKVILKKIIKEFRVEDE